MLSMLVFLLIAQFLSKKAANANSQEPDATISQKNCTKQAHQRIVGSQNLKFTQKRSCHS